MQLEKNLNLLNVIPNIPLAKPLPAATEPDRLRSNGPFQNLVPSTNDPRQPTSAVVAGTLDRQGEPAAVPGHV
jgi:hypothetical protein